MAFPSMSLAPNARRVLTLAMALLVMGLPLFAAPQSADEAAAENPTVDEIIAKHYEAIGGDHHQSVETMVASGVAVTMGMESAFTQYTKRPNKMLLEIYVQDMTGVQAFDGETAWWYMPFMGHMAAEPMPADMAQSVLESADFDGPIVNARSKGHEVELLGVEQVNGRDAYKIEINLKTGGTQFHYVDTESFYITRVVGSQGEMEFLDYKIMEGHPVPTQIEVLGDMGAQTIYIDDVEFGVELDDAIFRMQ